MKQKLFGCVFLVLLLLGALPLSMTWGEQGYLFGWLPVALAYWWALMVVNLAFVLLVCREFVRSSKKGEK